MQPKTTLLSRSLGYAAIAAGLFCTLPAAQAGPYVGAIPPYAYKPTFIPAPPVHHTGKEYSDELDRNAAGNLDAQQNIAFDGRIPPYTTHPGSGIKDTFDYNGNDDENGPQVDAIANVQDYLFFEVINDQTAILYSTRIGPNIQGQGKDEGAPSEGCAQGDPVCYETPGVRQGGTWATGLEVNQNYQPRNLNDPDSYAVAPRNLDGLEVFGPDDEDDANRFSLFGDSTAVDNNGVACAVFAGTGAAPATCYITYAELVPLFGPDYDIDGLMVYDEGLDETSRNTFDPGDWILVSLWPRLGTPGFNIGDAAYVYQKGQAGQPTILTHGGHPWTEGWLGLNVDALEAAAAPEPTTLALLGIGIAGLGFAGRRRNRA